MKKVLLIIFLLTFSICLFGCESDLFIFPQEMPDDFSFTLTFGFDGFYDSKTGVLKNGYNHDLNCECETILLFSKTELKEIYKLFLDSSIDKYDEQLIVSNTSVNPSYNINISFVADNVTKNIVIYGASYLMADEWENSIKLGETYYKIVDEYIKATAEFKSLPPNQKFYE